MSQENRPNGILPPYWLALLLVGLLICASVVALCVDYVLTHVLDWNVHQQCLFIVSTGALLHSIGLLAWTRMYENNTGGAEKRHQLVASILDHLGWALACLGLALFEARSEWHIRRELYFGLALLGSGLVIAHYVFKFRYAEGAAKSVEKGMSVLCGAMYIFAALFFAWRFIAGEPGLY